MSSPSAWGAKSRAAAAALLFLGSFGLYLFTLYPSIGYGDSGEMAAAAYRLGVNHPPSNPTYLLLGWAWGHLLPFEFSYSLNLLSAFTGALGVSLFFLFSTAAAGASPAGAIALSCALAVSGTWWGQATISEVYLLQTLFVGTVLAAILSGNSVRWRRPLALLAGVGMGVHYGTLFVLPSLLLAIILEGGSKRWRSCFEAVLFFLAGSSIMFYVYLRAGAVPDVDFGHIRGFRDFLSHVLWSNYSFRPGRARDPALLLRQSIWTGEILLRVLHLLILPAGAGLVLLVRKRSWAFLLYGPLAFGAMTVLFNYPSRILALGFGPPKLLPLVLWLFLAAAYGLTGPGRGILTGFTAVAAAFSLVVNFGPNDNSENRVSLSYGLSLLEDASGEQAALFVKGDLDVMPVIYLKTLSGKYDSVKVIAQNGLYFEDIYGFDRYPVSLDMMVREAAETRFIESFPGRVYYTHRPGYLEPRYEILPKGMVFEVRARGEEAAAAGEKPTVPPEVRAYRERAEDLEYREKAVLALYDQRLALHAGSALESEGHLRRAAALSPENPSTLRELGTFLSAEGRRQEALALYERAFRIDPTSETAMADYIQELAALGYFQRAADVAGHFLRLYPGNPYTLANLAALKRSLGLDGEASALEEEAGRKMEEWQAEKEGFAFTPPKGRGEGD